MTCPGITPPGFQPCTREKEHTGACAHWPGPSSYWPFVPATAKRSDPVLKFMNARCTHDHGDGLIQRELRHVKDHWLSCLVFCCITHVLWHGLEWAIGRLT